MESGLSIRPVQTTSVAPVRVESAQPRQVARTELPESQVVTAAAEAEPVRFDQDDRQQRLRADLNSAIDSRTPQPTTGTPQPTIRVGQDAITRELIFQKLSPSSGQVVQQFPDEAVMRQRAYAVQQRRSELRQALMALPEAPNDRLPKFA